MPFMHGRAAVSRTLQYLQQGQIILDQQIRVVIFAYNFDEANRHKYAHHLGLYNFVFWHLPQLKFKNPNVQMVTLKMVTPTPWIKSYFDDDRRLLIDCDSRSREEIHEHVKKILGQSEAAMKSQQRQMSMLEHNPANFGQTFDRQCICEVSGQVPCPSWQPLPLEMTGKGRKKLKEEANS